MQREESTTRRTARSAIGSPVSAWDIRGDQSRARTMGLGRTPNGSFSRCTLAARL
jgi:hypothetical protein